MSKQVLFRLITVLYFYLRENFILSFFFSFFGQDPTFSYHRFVQLLQCSCYSKHLVSGMVISIGGLQDSLRKASLSALLDYVQMAEAGDREFCLSSDILWVLQNYKRCDRVVIPTLKVNSYTKH